MKVYITKYALTLGIIEKEVEKTSHKMMVVSTDNNYRTCYHKPFWHESEEEAVKHAEILRSNKIASIKRNLRKLEKMNFSKTHINNGK